MLCCGHYIRKQDVNYEGANQCYGRDKMTAREILEKLLGITIDNEHKLEMLEAKKEDIDLALKELKEMVMGMKKEKTKCEDKSWQAIHNATEDIYNSAIETIADLFGERKNENQV